jgi:Flp pilus assembly protein TadD
MRVGAHCNDIARLGCAWIAVFLLAASPAHAASQSAEAPSSGKLVSNSVILEIQRALDEQRYLDAAAQINQSVVAGADDPRLALFTGELSLARGRYGDALASLKTVDSSPTLGARALQGEGIALSQLGRSTEAMQALQKSVAEDPKAWLAWNALGAEYDRVRDWPDAESAYGHAIATSQDAPIVLNNRGYSRLLQNRMDEAVTDFLAALRKKPDLSVARTNLRLAIAMKGEYERAIEGTTPGDKAAVLNNAGFAAILRGDYARAEDLLAQAMKARGEYYARASQNLETAEGMKTRQGNIPGETRAGAN